MAAKLESILRPIHWSLLLKTAVFLLAWLYLPFWLFLAAALYFYFFPLFRPLRFALIFLVILVFAAILSKGFFSALALGALFYLVLGIKDIILIKRVEAYETAIVILFLLASLDAFSRFSRWGDGMPFLWLIPPALLAFFLIRGFLRYRQQFYGSDDKPALKKAEVVAGLVSLIIWQLSVCLLFLPIDFLHQAAILFFSAIVLLQFLLDHADGAFSKKKAFFYFASFFALTTLVLVSAYS